MLLNKLFFEEPVIQSSKLLVKLRLCVFVVAWVHLCITAIVILPLDMSQDEDPKIRAYSWLKWRFITAWFNCIDLAYFPLCFYCDWKEERGEDNEALVGKARRLRDILFTSILFPTIMWADTMFWRLYWMDKSLISPPNLFSYLPPWGQHSLHTVSLAMAVADLMIIPRRRPQSVKPRLILMTAFYIFYCVVVFERYVKGEFVYELLGSLSKIESAMLVLLFYVEHLFYFSVQWMIIQYTHKRRQVSTNDKKEK